MTKTFSNGIIFVATNVLLGTQQTPGLVAKKYLNSVMAIRQALKFNCTALSEKHKVIVEIINDITKELAEEYYKEGKAEKTDEGYIIKDEFKDDFNEENQEKLNELSLQEIDIEIVTYPQSKLDLYIEKNDGNLTEAELEILELFVEEKEEKSE